MEGARILPALLAILQWLDDDATVERTEYLRESAARRLLDHVRKDLVLAGVEVPADHGERGPEFWRLFERSVTAGLRS